jgi:nucleoid-associated protein YgaU
MSQLVAGLALIVLAALVVFGALVEMSSSDLRTLDPPALRSLAAPTPAEAEILIRLGQGPNLSGRPAIMGYEEGMEFDNQGILTRSEKERVDRDGYLLYTIRKGETLSGLSQRYLGTASLWKVILEHNPGIRDERGVREGTVLRIPLFLRPQ